MLVTPTPSPTNDEIHVGLIEGPLVVFPDGSWSLLVSVLALLVSGLSLVWTLSATSRVRATAVRNYVDLGGRVDLDGDEIVITNVGRSPAVIYDVRAITSDGRRLLAQTMPRGPENKHVEFPELPRSLSAGDVLTVWFSSVLAGPRAGVDHGYEITYVRTGSLLSRTKPVKLTVRAADEPPSAPAAASPQPKVVS